jgi:hypothetical protein
MNGLCRSTWHAVAQEASIARGNADRIGTLFVYELDTYGQAETASRSFSGKQW